MYSKTNQPAQKSAQPLITVVIPAYNEEKLLAKTLACIRKQTYQLFDIIVIDNNSTDNTAATAKLYGAKVIREAKQGYVHALNRGLKEAKGEIIAVTDADSQPDKTWLFHIVKSMKSNVVGVTGRAKFDIKSKPLRLLVDNSYMFFTYLNFFIGKPHINGFNLAVRKKYVDLLGDLNPAYQIGADVHLGLSLKRYGKVKYTKKAIVLTSTRRWQKEAGKAFTKYSAAYLYTVWLRKPLPSKLVAIR